jgi:hypothetical protein
MNNNDEHQVKKIPPLDAEQMPNTCLIPAFLASLLWQMTFPGNSAEGNGIQVKRTKTVAEP